MKERRSEDAEEVEGPPRRSCCRLGAPRARKDGQHLIDSEDKHRMEESRNCPDLLRSQALSIRRSPEHENRRCDMTDQNCKSKGFQLQWIPLLAAVRGHEQLHNAPDGREQADSEKLSHDLQEVRHECECSRAAFLVRLQQHHNPDTGKSTKQVVSLPMGPDIPGVLGDVEEGSHERKVVIQPRNPSLRNLDGNLGIRQDSVRVVLEIFEIERAIPFGLFGQSEVCRDHDSREKSSCDEA